MGQEDVARTFITVPDTRLPTVVKADLSQRRGEETVLLGDALPAPPARAVAAKPVEPPGARQAVPRAELRPEPRPEPRAPAPPPAGLAEPWTAATPAPGGSPNEVEVATTVIIPQSATYPPQQVRPPTEGGRTPLPDGFVIARYRIDSPLGEGGFAITYRATDMNLDRRIVIKELFLPEHCEREAGLAIRARSGRVSEKAFRWAAYYFSQEAKITAELRHDSVVRLTDFFKTNGTAYIAYEMLEGSDFAKYCAARNHVFSHDDGLDILRNCADALLYVHERGFLHRDVKPSNIFIDGRSRKPVLIDFGSATATTARREDDFRAVSDGFSAPELYGGGAEQDERTDIYSLCATMYWALSGKRPTSAPDRLGTDPQRPLSEVVPSNFKYGERLSRVLDIGMRPDPAERYPDISSLMDDLFPRVQLPASGYLGEPRGDKIFLSYRREDSGHFSGRLLDFLEMRFGSGSTFFDVESIPAGIDFWDHIKSTLQRCAVLVVVIGPHWLDTLNRRRKRWYHMTKRGDFVESEIRAALEMRLPILPVLFDGAAMPGEKELPSQLRAIAGLNAAIIGSGKQFRQGADGVCDQIASIRATVGRRADDRGVRRERQTDAGESSKTLVAPARR